jgi:hypothetical protein
MMGAQPFITTALGLLMMYCKELPCCGMCNAAAFIGTGIRYSMEVITPRYLSSLLGTQCGHLSGTALNSPQMSRAITDNIGTIRAFNRCYPVAPCDAAFLATAAGPIAQRSYFCTVPISALESECPSHLDHGERKKAL